MSDPAFESWNEKRLDRLLVDYMLRKGMSESGIQLAHEAEIEVLRHSHDFPSNFYSLLSMSRYSVGAERSNSHSLLGVSVNVSSGGTTIRQLSQKLMYCIVPHRLIVAEQS
jgi:hypothetical protein